MKESFLSGLRSNLPLFLGNADYEPLPVVINPMTEINLMRVISKLEIVIKVVSGKTLSNRMMKSLVIVLVA